MNFGRAASKERTNVTIMNAIRSRANPVSHLLANVRAGARRVGQLVRHLGMNLPRLGDLAPLRPAPAPVPVRANAPVRSAQRRPVRW